MRAIILLVVLLASPTALGQNLVPNPGFERVEDGTPLGWAYNREVVSLVEGGAHEGRYSVKARTDKPVNLRYEKPYTAITLAEPVPVQADRVYWLILGFNVASFLYWKCYEPKRVEDLQGNIERAKAAGLKALVAVWLSELAPKDFRDKHPLVGSDGKEHKRTPSILHKEWWDEWFAPVCLRFVKQSLGGTVVGLWVDFELYDEPNQVQDVCFCPRCMGEFEKLKGAPIVGEEAKKRAEWLLEEGQMQTYRAFQAAKLTRYASDLRQETDKINPRFLYGNYPYYGHIADRVFAERLGTTQAPFLIAPEWTYRLQSDKHSDATGVQLAANYCEEMQRRIQEAGLNAHLLPGICPMTEATFMRDKILAVWPQADGYWLWTKRIIDRRRAAFGGKPKTDEEAEAAWQALKQANERVGTLK